MVTTRTSIRAHIVTACMLLTILCGLSACGYHLQGAGHSGDVSERNGQYRAHGVVLQARAVPPELTVALEEALRNAGIKIQSSARPDRTDVSPPLPVLRITEFTQDNRKAMVTDGREYHLDMKIIVEVVRTGVNTLPQTIAVSGIYQLNTRQPLAQRRAERAQQQQLYKKLAQRAINILSML